MKVINFDGTKYGLFVGDGGRYILSEDDACHHLYSSGETVDLVVKSGVSKMEVGITYTFAELDTMDEKQEFSLEDLIGLSVDMEVRDFVNYWGIKNRVHSNYLMLLRSMKEIGSDTSDMPQWGNKR